MNILFRTFAFLKPYWGRIVTSSICAALYSFFSAFMIWMVGPLLMALFKVSNLPLAGETANMVDTPATGALESFKDSIKNGISNFLQGADSAETLLHFCLLTLAVIVLKNAFNYLQGFIMVYAQQGMMRDVRNRLFDKYQSLSFDHFHLERTGSLMSRIMNDVSVLNATLDISFNRLIADASLVLMLLGFLIILSWKLTLMAALVMPALFLFIYFIGKKIRKYSERSQERMADVASTLEENISNIRLVKAFGTEEKEKKKFHATTQNYFKALIRMFRIGHLSSPINDSLASAAGIVMLLYAGSEVMAGSGGMDASDFIVFIVALFSLIKPAKSLTQMHARLQEGMAASDRIFKLLDTQPRVKEKAGAVALNQFRDAVEYRNVTFHYPGGPDVIRDVTFTAQRGEVIALVGPSGGGKSTLVDLLPRFYDPQSGGVFIDGVDVRDVTLKSLRGLLGIVTQETYLFNDTIAANIAYGVDDFSETELIAAARAANAHDFISEFADGYETVIGNRGVRLSGGQRQRLAIARALLRNPEILIFDEATSALDTESEALVQDAIDKLMRNRTALVVAHRLSTVRNADRILVVADGRIVESGSHESLLSQGGSYRRLHDMQYRLNAAEAEKAPTA